MTDWTEEWVGEIGGGWWNAHYADYFLLLTFGGIPWQVYFQRVLSSKSAATAEIISYLAAFGCIIMAVPPVLIGGIAKATHWNETDYFLKHNKTVPIPKDDTRMILPMVLQYLTPSSVSFFGLGAVSAAVMSSADSSVLSASSMFARNVYKLIFRQNASENEIMWVMRVSIFLVGGMATFMALTIPTIYGLWALCSDLVYVILFPQLLMVVHFPEYCNTYGSLFSYCLGMAVRISGGEKLIGLPPLVHFPGFAEPDELELAEADEQNRRAFGTQLFPFRTVAMILSMIAIPSVSQLMVWLFHTNRLRKNQDIFMCIVNIPDEDDECEAEREHLRTDAETEQEEGETIGMTTNTDVKKYNAVEEVNGGIPLKNGAELRKRKESLGKRQQSFVRQNSSGVEIERPLTREDLRKSFGSKTNSVSVDQENPPPEGASGQRKVQPLRKCDRKESLKQIKQGIKEGVKEVKEVVKDQIEHLPDGHRGSIASVTERPRYKLLDKQTKQTEL